jgi:glutathione peroxidase-family protein
MPRLQKLHEEYGPKGFSVVGIATDEEGAKLVTPAVAKLKVKYPILLTEPSTWKNYDVETLPALFLIDRNGQIVQRFGGNTEHKQIAEAVRKLVGE